MSKEQKIKTIKRLSRNYCEVQGDNNDCTKNPQDLIAEINTRVHDYIDVLDGKKMILKTKETRSGLSM